jgi:hypothetical protein
MWPSSFRDVLNTIQEFLLAEQSSQSCTDTNTHVHKQIPEIAPTIISVEVDAGVGGMIELLVEATEVLPGEAWDHGRVAARVHAVGVVSEKGLFQRMLGSEDLEVLRRAKILHVTISVRFWGDSAEKCKNAVARACENLTAA